MRSRKQHQTELRHLVNALLILMTIATILGCGGGNEIVLLVQDWDGPVEGVKIIQRGSGKELGVTDSHGIAKIKPKRGAGEVVISLIPPDNQKKYELKNSYPISDDAFKNRSESIRLEQAQAESTLAAPLPVTTNPPGAEIIIFRFDSRDTVGIKVGTTNMIVQGLEPGQYQIALRKEGYHERRFDRALSPLENPPIDTDLVPSEVRPGLSVISDPSSALVYLNGRNTQKRTPAVFKDMNPGSYQVKVTKSGYKSFSTNIELTFATQGRVAAALVKLAPPTPTPKPPSPEPAFARTYRVSTAPGWAKVMVDDETESRNLTGSFSVRLEAGTHQFRVVNAKDGVDVVLRYEVKAGDQMTVLILEYEKGRVAPRP